MPGLEAYIILKFKDLPKDIKKRLKEEYRTRIRNKFKEVLRNAVKAAMGQARIAMQHWRFTHFPHSQGKWAPKGKGYHGGDLIKSGKVKIPKMTSIFKEKKPTKPKNLWMRLYTDDEIADYASYVNKMYGVNWTTPGTVPFFFSAWQRFGAVELIRQMNAFIQKVDPRILFEIKLSKVKEYTPAEEELSPV